MIVLLAGLMLAVFANPSVAAVTAVTDTTWNAWPNTVYYLARLSGPNAPYSDIKVHITAVDQYKLWVNGNRIDTAAKNDGKWETVEEYAVTVTGTDLFIAVQVDNLGRGNGNGLMVDIDTGTDWQGTTIANRRSQFINDAVQLFPAKGNCMWYYYPGDITQSLGRSDWYKFDSTLFDDAGKYGLKRVMLGSMGKFNYIPNSHIEVVTGYTGDADIGSEKGGGIKLRRIDGEDLAYKKPCDVAALVDGDLMTGLLYQADPMGSKKAVDLEKVYMLNKLVLYTGGDSPANYTRNSVRGFAADISLDNYRYDEVGILQEIGVTNAENGGYEYYEIPFPPEAARYIQYRITATRSLGQPNIGEMMVFGSGYSYTGEYVSPWYDFGNSTVSKNYDRVTWIGDVPEGTKIVVQTQTLPVENGVPSSWSSEHTDKSFPFDSPEPAVKFRYKVSLSTNDPGKTPTLSELNLSFSKISQPLASAKGSIFPDRAPMGVDTTFVYTLNYKIAAGQDIKAILLTVPNVASVDSVVINGTDAAKRKLLVAPAGLSSSSSSDSLYITFADPIKDSGNAEDVLKIYFRSNLLKSDHTFEAGVFNSAIPANDGAGPMMVWHNADMLPVVKASSIIDDLLMDVKAVPKVLTPNGDGKNDFTVLEFRLAKTSTTIEIKIFDTNGTLVRKLHDGKLDPGDYRLDNAPGRWDGKNKDGDLVPPGIYIFQVVAKTDSGDKVKSGTVVVAY